MNLLIVLSHLRKGGVVEIVYNLCCHLLKVGNINLYILTLRKECKQTKINDFQKLGIPVRQLDLSYAACEFNSTKVGMSVQKIIKEYHIDMVHCHGYHPVLVCAKLDGVKKISTLHDRATEDFVNVFGFVVGRYMLFRYFRSLRLFDMNIAVGKNVAEIYQRYIPHVSYVNNGIDTEKYQVATEAERISLRNKFGLPVNKKIFVSTGRIEREKRYDELTKWFLSFAKTTPAVLLVLGEGKRLNACKLLAGNAHSVMFTGKVSNVVDYLKCADYYISYSKSEGMSLAVCEGMSCGLFPILSDIPSHRDIAEYVGGLFFNKIDDIRADEILEKTVDRGSLHQYIIENFSNSTMGQGYLEHYKRICPHS